MEAFNSRLMDPANFNPDNHGEFKDDFYFIQAADTQLGMMISLEDGQPGERWDKEMEIIDKALEKINKLKPKPKFLTICGDLVDAFPGSQQKSAQEEDFKKALAKLHADIPLVLMSGNHDIGNIPTSKSLEDYESNFGRDYFSFWVGGVRFLVINTQFFQDSSQVGEEGAKHERWLDSQLSTDANAKHTIVLQHIPYFLNTPDEPNEYFNIELKLRQRLLDKLKHAGCRYVFSGHYHRNAGGHDGPLEQVVTSALGAQLGDDRPGLRIVKVGAERVTHKYFSVEDIPEQLDLESF